MKDRYGEVTSKILNDKEILMEVNTALAFPAWMINDRKVCNNVLDVLQNNGISNVCITYPFAYTGRIIIIVEDYGKAVSVCTDYICDIEFITTDILFGLDN